MIIPDKVGPSPMMPVPSSVPTPVGHVLRENGILMLTKEFNQDNIMPLVVQIMEWNMTSDKMDHIKLYINSPGGSVHSAFHLIDVMKAIYYSCSYNRNGISSKLWSINIDVWS